MFQESKFARFQRLFHVGFEIVFEQILAQKVNNFTKDTFESDDEPQIPTKVDISKVVVVRTETSLHRLIEMLMKYTKDLDLQKLSYRFILYFN